ncbi:SEC-C metal-binding domain-containing protein [Geomicrobium sp. JCM 19037]|uniref:SEC-C metal-binding domain-containing protein n=1 Tax=Geomicrobium sp. JCM 19037 TaxID=1460634 RepID=UPI001930CD7C|nr:SEC-C metal-binding domain-containing protein [Geomicrobium sp. JCM 19037]
MLVPSGDPWSRPSTPSWELKGHRPNEVPGELAGTPRNNVVPFKPGQKVGRNEPCPCGSGKKYKKCCMD